MFEGALILGYAKHAVLLQARSVGVRRNFQRTNGSAQVCYEGIMQSSRQEIQRFMFWSESLALPADVHTERMGSTVEQAAQGVR